MRFYEVILTIAVSLFFIVFWEIRQSSLYLVAGNLLFAIMLSTYFIIEELRRKENV